MESVFRALGVTNPPACPRARNTRFFIARLTRSAFFILLRSSNVRFLQQGSAWRYAGNDIELKKNNPSRYQIDRASRIETWFDLSLPLSIGFHHLVCFVCSGS
jgi:hypothetical protein